MPVINANSVNPDQRPAASDLGLHCFQMPHLGDARPKWVKRRFHKVANNYVHCVNSVWRP